MPTANKANGAASKAGPQFTEQVSAAAHEAVDKAAERVGPAEETVREAVANTAETISEKKQTVEKQMESATEQARKTVQENPLLATGVAFVAGFALTSILSSGRKS